MMQEEPENGRELIAELSALRQEHQRVVNSFSYRLSRLLINTVRSPVRLLLLPWNVFLLWREYRQALLPGKPSPHHVEHVLGRWQEVIKRARDSNAPVVLIFSGTTSIQGTRGNRPIRQAQALLRAGTAVFFSYHSSRKEHVLPESLHPFLVQSPVDVTLTLLEQLAAADLQECRKLFVVSYPLPGVEDYVEVFRKHGWGVVYDCRDDWEEFAKVGMARWFKADVEQLLVNECDATLCVSAPLVQKMQRLAGNANVLLMPNAVEKGYAPADYQRQPVRPPVVGYFGHLSAAWFDWEALKKVALARPRLRFEIIGHSAPLELQLPENIVLLGAKPWQVLHQCASRWSAAIIPFRMGALADGVDPIKIYEYLALQLPVVSFRMPQIAEYPYTFIAHSVEEFCCALDAACCCQPDNAVLTEFIASNTWELRAAQLLAWAKEAKA